MNFELLVEHFSDRPFFELRELLALGDDRPKSLKNQLSKWVQSGKLSRLRRGKYLLEEPYKKKNPSVYYVANYLLRPSYVSLQTALQFHGLIPEAVAQIQSVTPKHGNEWETPLGIFKYFSIKQNRFWGYTESSTSEDHRDQNNFLMARPEKALLDLFYFEPGDWPTDRLREMRFQKVETLDPDTLNNFAERYDSPKVQRSCDNFQFLYFEEEP